jgi:hypothetical protein
MQELEAAKNDKDKEFTIIVNATPKVVEGRDLSFIEVVHLEFPNATVQGNIIYTVTYKKGPDSHKEGSMDIGDIVKLKKGMVFNVSATDKS